MVEEGSDHFSQNCNPPAHPKIDELSQPPSNKKLLCIAFVSFQSFATVQLGAAIFAGSEAMLGDSIAMMVDALAYLFNLVAEHRKEVYLSKLQQQNALISVTAMTHSEMVLKYRKYTYQLELIPPLFSITVLSLVTALVFKESIHTLILDSQRDASLQSDPNVNLMMLFSIFNLLLDLVNVGCFASASHALGYKTSPETSDHSFVDTEHAATIIENQGTHHARKRDDPDANNDSDYESEGIEMKEPHTREPSKTEIPCRESHDFDDRFVGGSNDDSTNLNMCSAYTHVFADTLRSFAVIFASLLAKFTTAISTEVADAAAAVVVSVLIFLSLFPLVGGMIKTFESLKDINRLLKMEEEEEERENEGQVELLPIV